MGILPDSDRLACFDGGRGSFYYKIRPHPEHSGLYGSRRRHGPGGRFSGGVASGRCARDRVLYKETEILNSNYMLGAELFLMGLIVYLSIKHRKYTVILLSVGQTALLFWSEFTHPAAPAEHMKVDSLSMLMCVIVAFVGGFICIYAVGYMKAYHATPHHITQRVLFLHAVSVPRGHPRACAFQNLDLDVFLLGNHQRDLLPAHRLHPHGRGGSQQLPRPVDESFGAWALPSPSPWRPPPWGAPSWGTW